MNYHKIDKFDNDSQNIEEDLISYIKNDGHFHNFINGKFYLHNNNYVVDHFIKLENLIDDIKYIFKIYDIKINEKKFEMLNNKSNVSLKKNFNINDEIKNLIFEYCKNDYKYGKY